jgi:hypothetical protein
LLLFGESRFRFDGAMFSRSHSIVCPVKIG